MRRSLRQPGPRVDIVQSLKKKGDQALVYSIGMLSDYNSKRKIHMDSSVCVPIYHLWCHLVPLTWCPLVPLTNANKHISPLSDFLKTQASHGFIVWCAYLPLIVSPGTIDVMSSGTFDTAKVLNSCSESKTFPARSQ